MRYNSINGRISGWSDTTKRIVKKREKKSLSFKENREREYKQLFAKIDAPVDEEENSLCIFDQYIVVRQSSRKHVIFFVDLVEVVLLKSKDYFTIKFERYRKNDNLTFNLNMPIEDISIVKDSLDCKVNIVKEKRNVYNKKKVSVKKIIRKLIIPVPFIVAGIGLAIAQSCGVAVPKFLGYFFLAVGVLILVGQSTNMDFLGAVLIPIVAGLIFIIVPILIINYVVPDIKMLTFLDMFVFSPATICVIMFEMLGAMMLFGGVCMVISNTIKNFLYKQNV